jgi:sulfofructose kinase
MGEASTLDALRATLAGRAAASLDVVGIGECSLDEVWRVAGSFAAGGKTRALAHELIGGGQIATAMAAGSRLGLRTAYAGAIGDDDAGRAVLAGLADDAVDTTSVHRSAGAATRSALVIVDEDGERTVVERVDRRTAVPPDALPEALIATARVLHLDGVHPLTSIAAARLAGQHGVLVSLDIDHTFPGIDELLSLADICFTGEAVPAALSGEQDLARALAHLSTKTRPGALVGCTLGARGAAALDGDKLLLSPAHPIDPVVDTTACGDTFRAAALRALLDGKSLPDLLRFANAAAALKCRALGRRGCPTLSELTALL